MTNTYPDDAPLEEKMYEEMRCLRMVLERLLRVMDEGLFVDYELEKFGKKPPHDQELDRMVDRMREHARTLEVKQTARPVYDPETIRIGTDLGIEFQFSKGDDPYVLRSLLLDHLATFRYVKGVRTHPLTKIPMDSTEY
jgi:hypothetical protein